MKATLPRNDQEYTGQKRGVPAVTLVVLVGLLCALEVVLSLAPRATDGSSAVAVREITDPCVQVSGNSVYCEVCVEFLVLVHR